MGWFLRTGVWPRATHTDVIQTETMRLMTGPTPSPSIKNPGLWLSRAGDWFHDDMPVRHVRLCNLLTRSIARDEEGNLIVTTGRDRLPFCSEDAPLLVRTVEDTESSLKLHLSNGATEALSSQSHLCMDRDGRIRSVVANRTFWALWSRSATQALLTRLHESGEYVELPQGQLRLQQVISEQDWGLPPPEVQDNSAP